MFKNLIIYVITFLTGWTCSLYFVNIPKKVECEKVEIEKSTQNKMNVILPVPEKIS